MVQKKLVNAFKILVVDSKKEKLKKSGLDQVSFEDFFRIARGKERCIELLTLFKLFGIIDGVELYNKNFEPTQNELSNCLKIHKKDGSTLLIDVKNTNNNHFSVSDSYIDKLFNCVAKKGDPLYFAISMQGYWGLFTPECLESLDRKLCIDDFVGEQSISVFDTALSTCSYMFEQKLSIRSVYKKKTDTGLGIKANSYGELLEYDLYVDDVLLFRIDSKDSRYFVYHFVLEGLQRSLKNVREVIETEGDTTTIIQSTSKDDFVVVPEYTFVLQCVQHMLRKEYKAYFDFLHNTTKKRVSCFCLSSIRNAFVHLAAMGLEIIVLKDNCGYTIEKYKNLFWS